MSIINMETGSSNVTAAKAFFAITIAITLYGHQLSKLLEDDLQIMLFIAGAIILGLSVIPVVKLAIRGILYVIVDRKLKVKSSTFWETMNSPQWENTLNDMVTDIYLASGFVIIFVKFVVFDPTFFDQSPIIISKETINFFIPVISLMFIVIVLFRLINRIRSNKFHLELSQHFLTIVETGGTIDPETEKHFTNRNWLLFENIFKKHCIIPFSQTINDKSEQIIQFVQAGPSRNKADEAIGWYSKLFSCINGLKGAIVEGRIDLHFRLIKYGKLPSIIENIEMRLQIVHKLYDELSNTGFGHENVPFILGRPPRWNSLPSKRHEELIQISLHRANLIDIVKNTPIEMNTHSSDEKFDEEWMISLHTQIERVGKIIEDFSKDWTQYCEQNSIQF